MEKMINQLGDQGTDDNPGPWSTYMQTPQFLESSRMMTLNKDMEGVISQWIGVRPGMRILDVGCGTGAFGFYVANTVHGCEFTGIDMDPVFIERAVELAKEHSPSGKNKFSFVHGDALCLPFESDYFDVVMSHTFFTNISSPARAMKEMMRVGKTGGVIASITAETFQNIPACDGDYPPSHTYYAEWVKLYAEVLEAYEVAKPFGGYVKGANPLCIPRFFSKAGLWDIKMHSVGRSFSLSNAAMPDADKCRYIKLSYEAEQAKFTAFCELDEFGLPPDKRERYLRLIEERRDALLKDIGENHIWEWCGGSNLCMTAVIPPKIQGLGALIR